MAGYVFNSPIHAAGQDYRFSITDENLAHKLHEFNHKQRVMSLQLDGDELDAALWGLEQYHKPGPQVPPHQRSGVWIAYHSDWSMCWVFLEEIEALRWAVDNSVSDVKFWEFGQNKPN